MRADGEGANALGVMSQGELLALSVSVFLPRAALDESPFRFAVIDDPVQAMDPAKVDGLARVLHRAARTRQIVVFTHDDRLPEAIRRLRLDATMLHVDRRARSHRRRAGLAQPGPALPRRRARLREARPPAARGPGARGADVLPQRGRGRRGQHRPPPRGRAAARASTRPTSRSRRRARCARRSRSCCSARPGARARSATEVRKRYGAAAAALVTELNRGVARRGARPVDAQAPAREHARVHPPADGDERAADGRRGARRGRAPPRRVRPATRPAPGRTPPRSLIRQSLESTLDVFWTQPRAGHAGRELRATAGRACPPSSATGRRRARPTSPGRALVAGLPSPRLRGRPHPGRAARAPGHGACFPGRPCGRALP